MKSAVFHDSASAELDEAIARYEEQVPRLGLALQAEVERVVRLIERNPRMGTPYKATSYRHLLVRRFPYVIYYIELDDSIWIAAVAHASRRPGYWMNRDME